MFKYVTLFASSLVTVAIVGTIAFGQHQFPSTTGGQVSDTVARRSYPNGAVAASVNGVPILETDVRFVLGNRGHDSAGMPAAPRTNVLNTIVRQELARQKAVELGLDATISYQEKLRRMEAQLNAFKRRELSELLWREIARNVEVSEAEIERYFADNAATIKTELHIWQILMRDEKQIGKALEDLKRGTPFEVVAGRRFPRLPKAAGTPWDLGFLKWTQVPEPWHNVVYNLKKGEISGVIRGPNSRFWILKLVDKRESQDAALASMKPVIQTALKNKKIEELREKTERELRAKATIVYTKHPIAEPEE